MLRKVLSLTVITLSSISVLDAQAGGLWLSEYNQPTMGRAGAGEEAGNGDAADAFFNPAFLRSKNLPVPGWIEREIDVVLPIEKTES